MKNPLAYTSCVVYTVISMIQQITIGRNVGDGKYNDVLDVCEYLAAAEYGSGTNTLVQLARKSPLFQETLEKLKSNGHSNDREDKDGGTRGVGGREPVVDTGTQARHARPESAIECTQTPATAPPMANKAGANAEHNTEATDVRCDTDEVGSRPPA